MTEPRVLIATDLISARAGGELILPWHWFRMLRRRGVEAWLTAHERHKGELLDLLGSDRDRVVFLRDTALHRVMWRLGMRLPAKLAFFTTNLVIRMATQVQMRRVARELVARHGINVVHQPIPVSPRDPSLLRDLGAPVVMGPMNGGMSYPPGFAHMEAGWLRATVGIARAMSTLVNRVLSGKRHAEVILVANERTRQALPGGLRGRVGVMVENGVDLSLWRDVPRERESTGGATRLVFVGRLIPLKAVDLLIEAIEPAIKAGRVTLEVVGDGPDRARLESIARERGVEGGVTFAGFLPQAQVAQRVAAADVLVLPSLHECGGAVVLEAMAMGRPVIAANWGGPADYLDESCGILVEPSGREAFVRGLQQAVDRLARDPELRVAMGQRGRARVESFDWERKTDEMLAIYRSVMRGSGVSSGV